MIETFSVRKNLFSCLAILLIVAGASHPRASDSQRGAVILSEDFSSLSLPAPPASTVIHDSRAAGRRVHTPTIVEGRGGVLVAAWLDYPPPGGAVAADMDSSNRVVFSVSADGGKTWNAPRPVDDGGSINPTFLRAPNGDLWLFYNRKNSDVQDDCSIWSRRTSDNGATWSEAKKLDFGYRVGIIVHNGIAMKNGDWLIAFHYDRNSRGDQFAYRNLDFAAGVMISTDQGASWKLYGEVEAPNLSGAPNIKSWPVEPAVVETKNGQLVMFLRTRAQHIYKSTSNDRGRTWTEAAPMKFSNADAKTAAIATRNGEVILLWNNTQVLDHMRKRFPLMASLSEDGGRTWPYTITLNDDTVPLHYPALVEVNGEMKIVYGHNLEQIRFVSLRASDLRHKWTAINKPGSWAVREGVLQMTDDREVQSQYEWTKWPKVVAFLSDKPKTFVLEADVRFDGEPAEGGAIGVFSSYQDEDNRLGWVWSPATGAVGMEKQQRFGLTANPTQYRESKKTWFEHFKPHLKPQLGKWYRVRITQREDHLKWELMERGQDKTLSSATVYTRYDGHFIALGALRVRASFDNVALRSVPRAVASVSR